MQLYEKETPTLEFFCEFCKNFQNTFFYRTPPVTASVFGKFIIALFWFTRMKLNSLKTSLKLTKEKWKINLLLEFLLGTINQKLQDLLQYWISFDKEAYSELRQTSKIECIAKIANGF